MTALLEVRNLAIEFGGIHALQDVSFDVNEHEICGLIGPNGAGKTTLFNAISRVYDVDTGTIRFAGQDITRLPTDRIIGLGVARTLQNVGLFGRGAAVDPLAVEREARGILGDLGLDALADHFVDGLPFGTLKRIELARALVARPRLVLLDEPANGLSHGEVDELSGLILWARTQYRLTVLLVEHHMRMLMRVSDRVVVLENGIKIADGTPQEVKADPRVAAAYLGAAA